MSKAQEKRNSQLAQILTNKLSNILIDFKNKYLTDYHNYITSNIELEKRDLLNILNSPNIGEYATQRYYGNIEQCVSQLKFKIDAIQNKLNRKALLDLQIFSEANESYENKFTNLITKLVKEQISTAFLKVEKIGDGTYNNFSILIKNKEVEIEARFIYACGEINAPHYRFIITKRTLK